MRQWLLRVATPLLMLSLGGLGLLAADPVATAQDKAGAIKEDLSEFRTVDNAITTRIAQAAPTAAAPVPSYLGVHVGIEAGKIVVTDVTADSPAAKAGLLKGDVLNQAAGQDVASPEGLKQLLTLKRPGDEFPLQVLRKDQPMSLTAKLGATSEPLKADEGQGGMGGKGGKGGKGFDTRGLGGYWKKPVFRLAVVCIEYPDVKHNPKITSKAWEDSLFSSKTYSKTSVTGQRVYGSLNDYYQEQSFGAIRVEGKVFDYVEVSKKRAEYDKSTAAGRGPLFNEAVDKLLARDGKDALKDYDGLFFMYAGGRFKTTRGSLYWPHRSTYTYKDQRWPYFICPEGGTQMANISVMCHEFGHMLGLPDLYARPENPGMEGVGVWCAMANQLGNGKPQHFSAWSKEKLGWIKPAVIDPTVKQKLILSPVEDAPKECFKVLVRADGSEYFLLENRRKKGFDADLPGEGLLIWRVVNNRPFLEESHGVAGPAGPRSYPTSVPYPSAANNAFTPYTTPSSRSQLGGGMPVYITNIRRLPDGRITFYIGYEFI